MPIHAHQQLKMTHCTHPL